MKHDFEQKQLDFEQSLVAGSMKAFAQDKKLASRDLWQMQPELLVPLEGFNVRIKDESYVAHVRKLADSMKQDGFFQDKPIAGFIAKKDGVQIVYVTDGHCRLEAVKLAIKEGAEIPRVPVVVSSSGTNIEDLNVGLVRANDGLPLKPLEIAVVCKRLVRFNWDTKQIAARLGFSDNYVEGLLLLIGAPNEVREMVARGEVAATTAIDTIRTHGGKALEKLRAGLEVAKSKGKARVTGKHIPGAVFTKVVKQVGTRMFMTLRDIKSDPAYKTIGPELREKLDGLLAQLDSLEGRDDALKAEAAKEQRAAEKARVAAEKQAKKAEKAAAPAAKKTAPKKVGEKKPAAKKVAAKKGPSKKKG